MDLITLSNWLRDPLVQVVKGAINVTGLNNIVQLVEGAIATGG